MKANTVILLTCKTLRGTKVWLSTCSGSKKRITDATPRLNKTKLSNNHFDAHESTNLNASSRHSKNRSAGRFSFQDVARIGGSRKNRPVLQIRWSNNHVQLRGSVFGRSSWRTLQPAVNKALNIYYKIPYSNIKALQRDTAANAALRFWLFIPEN